MISVIDRASDFRVLARWFAQAESDEDAHVLWRAAFGLCSARHLPIDEGTLDDRDSQPITPNTSWQNSPPLRHSGPLRHLRHASPAGGLRLIVDRSSEKSKLGAAANQEARRLLHAQNRFGAGNRIRLSELEHLEADEFEVFLDLLGEALSARSSSSEPVDISSGNGCLKVRLEPVGDGRTASLLTKDGWFAGPDHWLSIEVGA